MIYKKLAGTNVQFQKDIQYILYNILIIKIVVILFSCSLLYEKGVIKLINNTNQSFYYSIFTEDEFNIDESVFNFNYDTPPLPDIKPGEMIKIDIKNELKESKGITLVLFTLKNDGSETKDLEIYKVERAGIKFLNSSFWIWSINHNK